MKLPQLKEVRELHGWSQTKLAEESGVSRDSISNYETGHREAYPATAKRLADALDVAIADLVEPARELATSGKAEALATGPIKTDEPLLTRPEVQTWLRQQGHMTKEEFFSWAEEHESLEEIENAIGELHAARDRLLEALNDPATQETLFPRRRGLVTRKERVSETFRPGKLAWKLRNEIRNEYLARETALVNYSRLLFIEGEAEDYLVRGPISEYDHGRHEQMLEARRILEESYAKVAAV